MDGWKRVDVERMSESRNVNEILLRIDAGNGRQGWIASRGDKKTELRGQTRRGHAVWGFLEIVFGHLFTVSTRRQK